jgi:hypothetical protein
MTTIYDKLLVLTNKIVDMDDLIFKLDNELDLEITSNLITLLNLSCGIDLSQVESAFSDHRLSFDEFNDLEISYKFPYGNSFISVNTTSKSLDVSFSFSNEVPIKLYKNNVCYLNVDHNMQFEKCAFKRVIQYSKSTVGQPFSLPVWGVLIIYTSIDKDLNKTHKLHYQNNKLYSVDENNLINLFDKNINHFFKSPPNEFDELLFSFFNFNSLHSVEFYEVFPDYPDYNNLMKSVDYLIQFLNLFFTQYTTDKHLLHRKIELLEMRLI